MQIREDGKEGPEWVPTKLLTRLTYTLSQVRGRLVCTGGRPCAARCSVRALACSSTLPPAHYPTCLCCPRTAHLLPQMDGQLKVGSNGVMHLKEQPGGMDFNVITLKVRKTGALRRGRCSSARPEPPACLLICEWQH